MWAGVEPAEQKYNTTYLDIMGTIVELLGSYDIAVLFDMHQDVLSSRTGSYDGIPAWLYDKFPRPAHACTDLRSSTLICRSISLFCRSMASQERLAAQLVSPVRSPLAFTTVSTLLSHSSYLTEACSNGFQSLYNNEAGAIDSMGSFWRIVASNFKKYPNTIG